MCLDPKIETPENRCDDDSSKDDSLDFVTLQETNL